MASYFHVALTGPARTWLMNLTPGTIQSWEELCARFTANFASAYQQHGVEAYLHAVRQKPGETLRAFIMRFTKVRGTIPRISDASIITAFRQGVRDEKMLVKLATHEVESVTTFLSLADKCARAAHGTQPPKTETPKLVAPGLPSRAVARKRRTRTRVAGSHIPAVQSLQERHQLLRQRLGARMRMASVRARKVATKVHAQFIPPLATVPLTAARSRNSRSGSVGGVSRPPRTAHPLLASGLARRKPPTARPLSGRRSFGTNLPLGS